MHELANTTAMHKSPITNLVRLEDFEALHSHQCEIIHPFPSPPWEQPLGELTNLDLDRLEAKEKVECQVAEEEEQGAMVIFTDGSLIEKGGGASAVSRTEARSISCTSEGITNNELELLAIGLAVAQFQDNRADETGHQRYRSLAIFSDSQIALKRVHEPLVPKPMQHLAKSIKKFFSRVTEVPIRLYWTPGHEDVELNEKADAKAKLTAEKQVQTRLMPYSLSKILQITRSNFHLRTAGFTTGKRQLKTQPKKVADALARLEKGEAATIFHLRSGHSPLNDYLHRFNHHDTGKCEHCKIPETVAHFLLHCRHYKHQRKRFRSAIKEEGIKVNSFSLPSLLNTTQVYQLLAEFVLETGRFRFLKKHLPQEETQRETTR